MKIVYFCNSFPIASETFVIDQICSLIDEGYHVEILSLYQGDGKYNDKVQRYQLLDKVNYLLPSHNKIFNIIITLLNIFFKILNPKVLKSFNISKYGSFSKKLRLPFLASKKISSGESVYISHFGPSGVLCSYLLDLGVIKGKLITFFHGYDLSRSDVLKEYECHYNNLFNIGDLFLPVSHFWGDKLYALGCDRKKIKVLRMGINLNDFSFTPSLYGKNSQYLKIVTVSRLVEKKGLEYAIKACGILKKRGLKLHYTIVGYGELENELQNIIVNENVSDCVKIIGFKPHSEIKSILSSSHIFMLPSVTASNGDMEGIPVALMEAMASGIVVLSTFHSGIPELIEDLNSGLLVQERDQESIASKILEFLNLENKNYIVNSARNKIENDFNQEKETKKLVSIIEGLY